MELANMLLNQISAKNQTFDIDKNQNHKNNNFENVFNKTKNNIQNKSKSYIDYKQNDKYNKVYTYQNDNNSNDNSNQSVKSKNNHNDYKTNSSSNTKNIEENYVVEENYEKDEELSSNKDKKVILFDVKILDKLSEILNLPIEQIMATLSQLSMPISKLSETQNLIQFMQQTFDIEAVDLLSKDGIKDIMVKINDLAKSINYNDMPKSLEEVSDIIQKFNLQNVKIVDLENNDYKQLQKDINETLKNLNGEVIEVLQTKSNFLTENKTDFQQETKPNLLTEDKANFEQKIKPNFLTEDKADFEQEILNNGNTQEIIPLNNKEPKLKQPLFEKFQNSNNNFNQDESGNFLKQENMPKIEVLSISEISEKAEHIKTFNATLPKTQAFKSINSTEVISQIMEKMKTTVKQDMSEVKILLRPEHLGEVSLKIATQNGIVTAQFTAENQKVKEIIESNFNQLKDMLLEKGIDVGNLEVDVSDKGQQFNNFENQQQNFSKNQKSSFEEDKKEEITKINEKNNSIITNNQVDYAI